VLVDQPDAHTGPGECSRAGTAGGAGTDDQNVAIEGTRGVAGRRGRGHGKRPGRQGARF
jgi:hypothetical protein